MILYKVKLAVFLFSLHKEPQILNISVHCDGTAGWTIGPDKLTQHTEREMHDNHDKAELKSASLCQWKSIKEK